MSTNRNRTKENRTLTPKTPDHSTYSNDDEDVIDLVDLFYMFYQNLWKIILCMVIGGAVAFGYTKVMIPPTYTATSKIYVVSASDNSVIDLSDLQIGSQLTSDYQELLVTRPVLQDVIKNLNLDMDYKTLSSKISISNTTDTRILTINVTTTDAKQSADIANELVEQAMIYLPKVMETEEPNLVESAIVPDSAAGPSYSKNTLLGMIAGAVLMAGYLAVRYLMNDAVITSEDVMRYYGTLPLGAIPENVNHKRKGKREYR